MRAEIRDAVKTPSCDTMSESRRELLQQFDTPSNLTAFLSRPEVLFNRVEQRRKAGLAIRPTDLSDVEIAILSSIVMILPARRANLCTLRHKGEKRSLRLARHRAEKSWLYWTPDEVKNDRHLRAELDSVTERMIRVYIEYYRPIYLQQYPDAWDSDFLFAGSVTDDLGSGHRNLCGLGTRFKDRMREVGLDMTFHPARHLAAKILVDSDARMVPVAALLLGDSETVVRQFYLENRTETASAALRQHVLSTRHKFYDLAKEWVTSVQEEG